MEKTVAIYPFPFGTRVFIRMKGAFREAKYRGFQVKGSSTCGTNVITKHIFWLGSKEGEMAMGPDAEIYMTIDDVMNEANRVYCEKMSIESFSLKYLRHLVWDGIQFTGWIWDGARPAKWATRECLRGCEIRDGKISLINRHDDVCYDIDNYSRFFQTREECSRVNTPTIIMLDEDDNTEGMRHGEFYEYVRHHCPGFEDKIKWERFVAEKGMPWNLSDQVMFFIQTS